jgi:hypothetical protein
MDQIIREAIEIPPDALWGFGMYLRKPFSLLPVVCKIIVDDAYCEICMLKMGSLC